MGHQAAAAQGPAVRRQRRRRRLLAAAALLVCVGAAAVDSRLAVRTYTSPAPQLSAPLRLALITDFHSCDYGAGQAQLLSALEAAQPDLVLLGGDIFDDDAPGANTLELIPLLLQRWSCCYVTGNHEWRTGRAEALKAWFSAQGVTVLAGDCTLFSKDGAAIALCGVDDPDVGEQAWAAQLEKASAQRPEGVVSLLLSHRPERIETYLSYGFDVILAGHAHGGQWRLPGLINGLAAPNQGLFPRYAGGRYDLEGTVLVVSRGLARETTRLPRIFNRPELVLLDLVPDA